MSKTIFLVRHAKSSWEGVALRDKDRPLNDRGYRDAPVMAQILASRIKGPVRMISSPAVRAFTTAGIFRDAMQVSEPLVIKDSLYYGDEEDYLAALREVDEQYQYAVLFRHNPKVEYFCRSVKDSFNAEIPTCAVVGFTSEIDRWNDLEWNNLQYKEHFFPKEL